MGFNQMRHNSPKAEVVSSNLAGRAMKPMTWANRNYSVSRQCPGEKLLARLLSRPAERASGLANGSAGLFPPPALSERCHRGLARRVVAVRRRAVFVVAMGRRRAAGRMVAPTARGNGSALHGRDGTRAAQQQ